MRLSQLSLPSVPPRSCLNGESSKIGHGLPDLTDLICSSLNCPIVLLISFFDRTVFPSRRLFNYHRDQVWFSIPLSLPDLC